MNENYEKMFEQQSILLSKLEGDAKKQYYIEFFTNSFIQALKCRRKEMNLSQKDIAKLMGVKQSYISKIENLEKAPTIDTLAKYCFALSFSAEEIHFVVYEIYENKQVIPNFFQVFDKTKRKWSLSRTIPFNFDVTLKEAIF